MVKDWKPTPPSKHPHRDEWAWDYQRPGVMPDYVSERDPQATRDNVWAARSREQRARNEQLAKQWRERARFMEWKKP